MSLRKAPPISIVLVWFLLISAAAGQAAPSHACVAPSVLSTTDGQNLFTDEMETEMGSMIAQALEHDLPVIRGPINDYLQRVGTRILKQMPASHIGFRFVLVDEPSIDAFGFLGGHIYVSRKLVLAASSEDELAGVVAHEIGHIITHQSAIEMSRVFQQLGIAAPKTKQEVVDAYNKVLDNKARIKSGGGSEEHYQFVADQIAVYALVRAGYRVQSYGEFWNRVTEIHGKTGSWLSDFFHTTKPESKRLRAILEYAGTLPTSCVADDSPKQDFAAWKTLVLENSAVERKLDIPGLVSKQILEPPLRPVIFNVAFSPDGKYVLAQDDGNIYVLTREPLKFVFRITAKEAHAARFTPDSESVLFYTGKLRVERWNVASQKRDRLREISRLKSCLQTQLSSSGSYLACFDEDSALNVIDTATGETLFTQKDFYSPSSISEFLRWIVVRALSAAQDYSDLRLIEMEFSPDEHYFLAARNSANVAVDMPTRRKIALPGSVREIMAWSFTFMGNDRLAGTANNSGNSKVVRFPTGETLNKIVLGEQELAAAAHGDYLLLRPIKDSAVGVLDINKNRLVISAKKSAMDVFEDFFAVERVDGELGIFSMTDGKRVASVSLPRSSFGRIISFDTSPDFKYLAVSERSRGAVWDLDKGSRIFHIQGFTSAYIPREGAMLMDFPEVGKRERSIARLDPATGAIKGMVDIGEQKMSQFGKDLITTKINGKKGLAENVTIEVSDIETKKILWSRNFPKTAPGLAANVDTDEIAFILPLADKSAQESANSDPATAAQLSGSKDYKSELLIEVVNATTGVTRGKLIIETGNWSFIPRQIAVAGDWVVVKDNNHRIMVYSLLTHKMNGRLLGETIYLSSGSALGGVETEDGKFAIYDLNSLEKKSEVSLPSPFSMAKFSPDGKRLMVITEDQTAYMIDVNKMLDAPTNVTAAK